jgi:hypothetical protein
MLFHHKNKEKITTLVFHTQSGVTFSSLTNSQASCNDFSAQPVEQFVDAEVDETQNGNSK